MRTSLGDKDTEQIQRFPSTSSVGHRKDPTDKGYTCIFLEVTHIKIIKLSEDIKEAHFHKKKRSSLAHFRTVLYHLYSIVHRKDTRPCVTFGD